MSIIEKTVLNEVQLEELKKPSNVKGQDDDNNFEKAIIISQPADRSEPFLAFLFLGPSGKSYLAEAFAGEAGSTFFSITPVDVGGADRFLKQLLESDRKPGIMFIKNIHSFVCHFTDEDSGLTSELLVRMKNFFENGDDIYITALTHNDLDRVILKCIKNGNNEERDDEERLSAADNEAELLSLDRHVCEAPNESDCEKRKVQTSCDSEGTVTTDSQNIPIDIPLTSSKNVPFTEKFVEENHGNESAPFTWCEFFAYLADLLCR